MEFIKTKIADLLILKPKVFEDKRGYFFESYNKLILAKENIMTDFVQINESKSLKNVLRGLHFQHPPYAQAKLVRVIKGSVLDIAVDIRKSSPTYGKWHSIVLSEKNKMLFYIPIGFAHGFVTLEDNTIFEYLCSNFYNKDSEDAIIWNDEDININWNVKNPTLSDKDQSGKKFSNFVSPF